MGRRRMVGDLGSGTAATAGDLRVDGSCGRNAGAPWRRLGRLVVNRARAILFLLPSLAVLTRAPSLARGCRRSGRSALSSSRYVRVPYSRPLRPSNGVRDVLPRPWRLWYQTTFTPCPRPAWERFQSTCTPADSPAPALGAFQCRSGLRLLHGSHLYTAHRRATFGARPSTDGCSMLGEITAESNKCS
jgi:hypothetical protein